MYGGGVPGVLNTLADLLGAAADRDSDGLALRDQGEALLWCEAATRAGRIGAALDDAGVVPGDRVGVHYRKSADAFLAMHAVVQRGAVAVPLDPTAPGPYLSTVVAQTGCEVLATHRPCARSALALAADAGLRAVVGIDGPTPGTPDRDGPEPYDPDRNDPGPGGDTAGVAGCRFIGPDAVDELEPASPRRPAPDDLAYIITTSGSTGVPKGIAHTHASALAYVDFKRAAYDLGADDRVSDIAPNHVDISTVALWVSPAVGAANVVVPEPHQMLPASLSQLAADERISFWYSVPYLLTQLLDRGRLEDRDLSALRWILFGGEPFPPLVLGRLMAALPAARFSNVYGPDGPPPASAPIPLGRPVADPEVSLVGSDTAVPGQEPTLGETGEIWVCAPTMMAGYWQRPDLDRRCVVTDADGARWYRTGDLAHRRPAGELVFTGRVDHQVKVRGHRVELEAIETVLEEAPGVANAVATVARSDDGADSVVAGLAPADGAAIDHDAVRRHAADRLPAYAVPAALIELDARPMTGSGKLDRRSIRATLTALHPPEGTTT